jgi:hypothetical protein
MAKSPLLHAEPTTVIEAITPTPLVQGALRDRAESALNARRELAKRLEAASDASAKAFSKHQSERLKATATIRAAEQALAEARAAATRLEAGRTAEAARMQHDIDGIVAELEATAHPAIDQFIADMGKIMNSPPRPVLGAAQVERSLIGGLVSYTVPSNFPEVTTYIRQVREAREAAALLRLEADQTEIPSQLEALRPRAPKD